MISGDSFDFGVVSWLQTDYYSIRETSGWNRGFPHAVETSFGPASCN